MKPIKRPRIQAWDFGAAFGTGGCSMYTVLGGGWYKVEDVDFVLTKLEEKYLSRIGKLEASLKRAEKKAKKHE